MQALQAVALMVVVSSRVHGIVQGLIVQAIAQAVALSVLSFAKLFLSAGIQACLYYALLKKIQ